MLKEDPTPHGTSGNLFLGSITGEVSREEREVSVLRGHWAYHALQVVWEWRAEGEPTGTNLDRPVVELPLVREGEGAALLRIAARRQASGAAGYLWRGWYRIRPGFPFRGGPPNDPGLLDLTGSGPADPPG